MRGNCFACMKTLRFVNGIEVSFMFLLLSILVRHISLQAVSPDACIRHLGGMSIFPGGVALNERA